MVKVLHNRLCNSQCLPHNVRLLLRRNQFRYLSQLIKAFGQVRNQHNLRDKVMWVVVRVLNRCRELRAAVTQTVFLLHQKICNGLLVNYQKIC
jgi:hypothetical protein